MKTRKTIEHVNLKQHIPLIVVFETNLIRAEEGALAQTGSRNLCVIGLHNYI